MIYMKTEIKRLENILSEAEVKTCAGSDGKATGVDFRRADERTG